MVGDKKTHLPDGLPSRFTGGKGGLTQLCRFLGIRNREQRQALLKDDRVRHAVQAMKAGVRNRPTSERERVLITAFYELRNQRLHLWQETLKVEQRGEHEPGWLVPSFEYHAVTAYDPQFIERTLNDEQLAEVLSDFRGTVNPVSALPEWQRAVLSIWPDLRQDLIAWTELPEDRRNAVALAVFAVATVFDDSRFLHWAADRVETLREEFAFALGTREPDAKPSADDPVQKWRETCTAVATCAARLGGDPPEPELLQDLQEQVRTLEQLHSTIVSRLSTSQSKNLVTNLVSAMRSLASEHDVPWLQGALDQIHAQWSLVWLATDVVDLELVRADVERASRALPALVREWRACQEARGKLEAELNELRAQSAADLASQLTVSGHEASLQAEAADATTRARECMLSVLRTVAPDGYTFEPTRDYATEWLRTTPSGQFTVSEDSENVSAGNAELDKPPVTDPLGDDDTDPNPGGAAIRRRPTPVDTDEAQHDPPQNPDAAPHHPRPVNEPELDRAVATLWQSLEARPGIAYAIAHLLTEHGYTDPDVPPAELVAAVVLADHVQSPDGPIVQALRPILAHIETLDLSRHDQRQEDAINLLLFSATLKPTLLAPVTGAISLLRRLKLSSALAPVSRLMVTVADHAERLQGVRLDASLLGAAQNATVWQEKFSDLSRRVQDWHDEADTRHNKLARARRVWARWLRNDGCIGDLARLLTQDDPKNQAPIRLHLKRLRDPKDFDALVQDTDRHGKQGRHSDIVGGALKQLHFHVQPLLSLGDEWLRLMDARPNPTGFVETTLVSLRRHLSDGGPLAHLALNTFRDGLSTPIRTAAIQAAHSLEKLCKMIDGDDFVPDPGSANEIPQAILSRDLLYVSALHLDGTYQPQPDQPAADILRLLVDTTSHAPTMPAACHARIGSGNLSGATLACDHLAASADADLDACRSALSRAVRLRRKELTAALEELEDAIEEIFYCGQLDDDTRSGLIATIINTRSELDNPDAIDRAQRYLQAVRRTIDDCRAASATALLDRLQTISSTCSDNARHQITKSIDDGYLSAAIELISRIEDGESIDLSATDQVDPFQEFVSLLPLIAQVMCSADRPTPSDICRVAAARGRIAGVSFENMSDDQAKQAARLLHAWYDLATAQRLATHAASLDVVLQLFGLQVRSHKIVEAGRRWAELALETDALQDRSLCPVPEFGSVAAGSYRLLLNWVQPISDSIARNIGSGLTTPTIILHFGHLDDDRRRLRQLAITRQRQFLVVDESLLLYLSSRPTGRLPALFRCSLPYTAVEPYVTTSSLARIMREGWIRGETQGPPCGTNVVLPNV